MCTTDVITQHEFSVFVIRNFAKKLVGLTTVLSYLLLAFLFLSFNIFLPLSRTVGRRELRLGNNVLKQYLLLNHPKPKIDCERPVVLSKKLGVKYPKYQEHYVLGRPEIPI